jgi:hypothetical protein
MAGHQLHDRRWRPVNALKNSNVTIQIVCSWSGKRFNIPSGTKKFIATDNANNNSDDGITFDNEHADSEVSAAAMGTESELLGSTTLLDLIKRVKKDIPGLYLWDEVGGGVLVCGPNHVFQNEWETTMICDLIRDTAAKKVAESRGGGSGTANDDIIPRVVLEDGREAVVITIGTPESILETKHAVVQRCLAKGDVYG